MHRKGRRGIKGGLAPHSDSVTPKPSAQHERKKQAQSHLLRTTSCWPEGYTDLKQLGPGVDREICVSSTNGNYVPAVTPFPADTSSQQREGCSQMLVPLNSLRLAPCVQAQAGEKKALSARPQAAEQDSGLEQDLSRQATHRPSLHPRKVLPRPSGIVGAASRPVFSLPRENHPQYFSTAVCQACVGSAQSRTLTSRAV